MSIYKTGDNENVDDETIAAVFEAAAGPADSDILALARQGDNDAYAQLWMKARPMALHFAKVWGCESPEDAVGEAGVRVLGALRDGHGPTTNFTAYVVSVVRNVARAKATWRRETLLDDESTMLVVAQDDVEATALAQMERLRIDRVFDAMPPREAALLKATAQDGLSLGAAAAQVGIGVRHASVVVSRARKTFQRLWIQSHLTVEDGLPADCRWELGKTGAYLADTLTKTQTQRFKTHLKDCDACSVAIDEVRHTSRMWGRALGGAAGLLPGGFATTAWGAPLAPVLVTGGTLAVAAGITAGLLTQDIAPETPPPEVTTTSASPAPTPSSAPVTVQPPDSPAPVGSTTLPSPVLPPPVVRPPASSAPVPPPSSPARESIVVLGTDSGPAGLCYPVLSGSAAPGSTLTLTMLGGRYQVTVGADGQWVSPRLTAIGPGSRAVSVGYAEGAPQAVSTSPQVAGPPSLSVTPHADSLVVGVNGLPGQSAEVLIDGQSQGVFNLDETGHYRVVWPPLAPGQHTVSVRYASPACAGPSTDIDVTV